MNYAGMSENQILKMIVEDELLRYEAHYGKPDCRGARLHFLKTIMKKLIPVLAIIILMVFLCKSGHAGLLFSPLGFVFIIAIIQILGGAKSKKKGGGQVIAFSLNPVTNYIMALARENPDMKISNLIRLVCTGNGVRTEHKTGRKAGIILTLLILLLAITGLGCYYLIPRASYTDLGDSYALESYKLGFSLEGSAVIPDTYEGKPVVSIGSGAFRGNPFLRTVELPDTLLTIQGEAFKNCKRLEKIVIPEGVTELRGNTFEGCESLQEVVMNGHITEIHAKCFYNCKNLRYIELPPEITEIKESTFEGCRMLRSIVIPDKVTRIAAHAFYGCVSLEEVTVPPSVESIGSSSFRKCNSLDQISLPTGISINERAFKESPTKITYYTP